MKVIMHFLLATLVIFIGGCSQSDRLCKYTLNPDVSCRICDENADRGKLVEYFNLDTNELRLFIVTETSEIEIEHPKDKVVGFNEQIRRNTIKFDPTRNDELSVNGTSFTVSPIRK